MVAQELLVQLGLKVGLDRLDQKVEICFITLFDCLHIIGITDVFQFYFQE